MGSQMVRPRVEGAGAGWGSATRRGRVRTGMLVLAGAGVLVVGGVVAVGAARTGESSAESGSRGTLDLHTATRSTFEITTTASGELEAKNQIELRNKLRQGQATITEIIEEGRMVKKGDLLVRLNDEEIKKQLAQESLQVQAARAQAIAADEAYQIQLNTNESEKRKANLKVDLAELDLAKWLEGEVKTKRLDNKLALDKAQDTLTIRREEVLRSRALKEKGFISAKKLQEDELALKEAEAALEKANLAASTYEQFEYPKDEKQKRSDLEEAKAELERVERKNSSEEASKKAELEKSRETLKIRENELAKLEEQLKEATLTAPSDGLVVYGSTAEQARMGWFRGEGPLAIGSQVYNNQLLVVLPDTSAMIATVRVHESLASRIAPGQPVNVKVEAAGGRVFAGTVVSKGVLAESGGFRDPNLREYTVKIDLKDIDEAGLKPSMRCEAEIKLAQVNDALTVPLQAVFSDGPVRYVYVPSGPRFVKRPVKVGRRSERFIEVAAGLKEGEVVLLRQPQAGEVADRAWNPAELAAVGLKLGERGEVESVEPAGGRGRRPGGPGAGPVAVAAPGPGGPAGAAVALEAPAETTTGSEPAAESPAGEEGGDKPAPANGGEQTPAAPAPAPATPVAQKPVETAPTK